MARHIEGVRAQVDMMLAVWRQRGGDVEQLTLDAFDALRLREDIAVETVPEFISSTSPTDCSVAGGYRSNPPTLVVTESMSIRRRHFTVLHELGHHLQRTDLTLGKAVLAHPTPGAFEESACEAFAAQALLPDDLVANVLGADGPTARGARALFETSNASRAAIAVRLVNLMHSAAVAVVLDESGAVMFATSRGNVFQPARGSSQRENPLVRTMLDRDDREAVAMRSDARIHYSTGGISMNLYGQGVWIGDHIVALMVEEGAPWLAYSPPQDGTAKFRTFGSATRQPVRSNRTCSMCFFEKHPSQFPEVGDTCLECAA